MFLEPVPHPSLLGLKIIYLYQTCALIILLYAKNKDPSSKPPFYLCKLQNLLLLATHSCQIYMQNVFINSSINNLKASVSAGVILMHITISLKLMPLTAATEKNETARM